MSSIILNSLPSLPGPYSSTTSVVGLVQRVVVRAFTGPFATASFQLPVKLQALLEASQVPSLTMTPVDMLSFHVAQYLPDTLSKPVIPWPVKGMPLNQALTSSTRHRPPSTMERVALPVSSIAGLPGSCQLLILRS